MIQFIPLIKYVSGFIGFIFLGLTYWSFVPEVSVTGGIISGLFSILFCGITYAMLTLERKFDAVKELALSTAGKFVETKKGEITRRCQEKRDANPDYAED